MRARQQPRSMVSSLQPPLPSDVELTAGSFHGSDTYVPIFAKGFSLEVHRWLFRLALWIYAVACYLHTFLRGLWICFLAVARRVAATAVDLADIRHGSWPSQ